VFRDTTDSSTAAWTNENRSYFYDLRFFMTFRCVDFYALRCAENKNTLTTVLIPCRYVTKFPIPGVHRPMSS
jgi:hypothetical protein